MENGRKRKIMAGKKKAVESGFPRTVAVDTARKWMHELGFQVLVNEEGNLCRWTQTYRCCGVQKEIFTKEGFQNTRTQS